MSSRIVKPYGMSVAVVILIYPIASITQLKFFYLAALLTFIFAVIYHVALGIIPGKIFYRAKSIYLFFVLAFFSYLWALYPEETLFYAGKNVVYLWVFQAAFIALICGKRRWLDYLVVAIPITCAVILAGIYAKYNVVRPNSIEMYEAVGSFSNLAIALTEICLPFLLYLFRVNSRLVLVGVSIAACFFTMVISQSRGGYLMLGITIVLVVLLFGRNIQTRVYNFIRIAALYLAVLLITLPIVNLNNLVAPVVERFKHIHPVSIITEEPTRGMKDFGRVAMYYAGQDAIRNYGDVGIGYGGLKEYVNDLYGFPMVSHNLMITAWGELGFLGLTLFVFSAFVAFRGVLRRRRFLARNDVREFYFRTAALVALVVAVVHGMFRPQLDNPMFYVLLAIVYSFSVRDRLCSQKTWNAQQHEPQG